MKKILVVDDSDAIREMVQILLEESGYEPIACRSGEEAVLHLKEADAVVTDLQMPGGMSGAQLAEITKRRRDIPVLIMTGEPRLVPKGHLANEIVSKPFRNESITSWVERVLGKE